MIAGAQEEARGLGHNYIGTEHLLLSLVREGSGVGMRALEMLDISAEAVREQVEEIVGRGERAPSAHIPFTPRAKKVLELSLREALQLRQQYIGTEHILLALIREGEGVAAQVLNRLGADLQQARSAVAELVPPREPEQGLRAAVPARFATRGGIVDALVALSERLDVIEAHLGIRRAAGAAGKGAASTSPAAPGAASGPRSGPETGGEAGASEPGAGEPGAGKAGAGGGLAEGEAESGSEPAAG